MDKYDVRTARHKLPEAEPSRLSEEDLSLCYDSNDAAILMANPRPVAPLESAK